MLLNDDTIRSIDDSTERAGRALFRAVTSTIRQAVRSRNAAKRRGDKEETERWQAEIRQLEVELCYLWHKRDQELARRAAHAEYLKTL
jgi:hypothetical protein